MTYDDATAVRTRLDEEAARAPEVGFTAAEVIRRGRRRRAVRRGAAAGSAVVAVALVIGVPVALLHAPAPDRITALSPDEPASPGTATPGPAATPAAGTSGPIPGVSAAEAARIARGCGRSYGGHVNPTPGPGETSGPLIQDAVRLYNLVTDAAGSHALLYGPGVVVICDIKGTGYNAGGLSGGSPASFQWLPGPVSIDLNTGDETSRTIDGRVTSAVAEVEVRAAGRVLRVGPVNGTYIARFTGTGPVTVAGTEVEVIGYARNGDVVEARKQGGSDCYVSPDGTVVLQEGRRNTGCRPATPWR